MEERQPYKKQKQASINPLSDLASISPDAYREALARDMDSANPVLLSEIDSKIAIAHAIKQAMQYQDITVYQLHEVTGLAVDTIDAFISAQADLSDSLPITKLD